jgi:low temperature requirement protein LtrA
MFKQNEDTLDRTLRLAAGIVFLTASLFWLGTLQGNLLGLVIARLGVIGLVSGITGFCPTYVLLGVSTLEPKKKQGTAS